MRIGLKYFYILIFRIKICSVTTVSYPISLTNSHENVPERNSLIIHHESVKSNLPLLATFHLCYCYSQRFKLSPCSIITPPRMDGRSPATKRSRPSSSQSPHRHTQSSSSRTSSHSATTSPRDRSASSSSRIPPGTGTVPRPTTSSRSANRSLSRPASNSMTKPHVNPRITDAGKRNLDQERRENKSIDNVCNMCSDADSVRRHPHFSTTSVKRMALHDEHNKGKNYGDRTYMCPICHVEEPVKILASQARRIVLADSTLHGVWDHPLPKGSPHFDIDVIVGGRVKDMTRAFMKNYQHMPNRMEIVVVCGINNIGAGDPPEQIVRDMDELVQLVKEHSIKWNHAIPSYVVFCTVMYAPKFCSLKVPPSPPEPEIAEWVPSPSFRNRYSDIKQLNDLIIERLKEGGQNLVTVRLDYQGVKRFPSGLLQHRFDNKPGAVPIWRETEVFKKLHFTMENKLKIVAYIIRCFVNNTRILSQNQPAAHD